MNIQLGKYKGFDFKRPDANVKDEEINEYIDNIREKYKVEVEKGCVIEKGDYITMDYDAYHEGLHIPEASRKNYNLRIGQEFFLEEFEAHLLGLRKGDIVKFDLVLPYNYQIKHLRDEAIHFAVKIVSVMNRIIPELTDDAVKNFKIEGINNIHQLKQYAKNKVYYQKVMAESANVINKIMSKVIEGSTVELKNEEIENLQYEILEDFKKQLEKKNANLEIYLSYMEKTEEEIFEQCQIEAQTYLTEKAIIEKIAKIENIRLNDEEKEKYKTIEEPDALNELLYQKVIHFLLKENTISDKN